MPQPHDYSETAFLRGGGATGEIIARHDWTTTSLGPPSTWPQHLKTATAMLLRSPMPFVLFWGAEGAIIYNDAYAVLVGPRHPSLLGAKVHEAWPDIADFTAHVIKTVMAGGSLKFRDQELTLQGSGRPEKRWFDLDYSPVPDERGQPAGVLGVVMETTERVLAERKAAAHTRRQQRMFEQAPGFIALLRGPDYVYEFVNETHKRLFGERHAVGRSVREVFADLPEQGLLDVYDKIYATGERYVGRAQPLRLPGPGDAERELFLDFILQPVIGEDGVVTGIFIEGFDVTEQVRAQAAAQESERRLSAAIAIARLGAFEWNVETRVANLDGRAREIYGFGPDENLVVEDLIRRIEGDDFRRIKAESAASGPAGPRREFEYRVHLPDGAIRDVVTVSDAVAGPDGRTVRIIGVFADVTERRRAENRQRLLIKELNHRVKNTLATVQSIAAQTLRSAPDLLSARDAFEARLVALAAAHDLLTMQSWRGARLTDVVASAMAPFETVQRPQISRSGPPVWVTAPHALALSLALHELATNAAKYGALSVPDGLVTIHWGQTSGELTLSWMENGGPAVAAPARTGFGTRLLQRSLAQELGGGVDLTFAPEGVRCEIRCQIEDVGFASALELLKV